MILSHKKYHILIFHLILFIASIFSDFGISSVQASSVNMDSLITNDKQDTLDQKRPFGFHSLVDRLDSFFSDEQIEDELQTSSLRFKPGFMWKESGRLNYPVPVRINIVLPRLQNRWQILFTSLPDDDNDQDPDDRDYSDDRFGSTATRRISSLIGLQFSPFSGISEHLKFISGIKIRTNEFNPFTMMRVRFRRSLGDWNFRFIQSGFWFSDIGFGERTQVDFGRSLGDETWFRSRSSALYSKQARGVDLKQTFFVRHFIGENTVLGTYWRVGAHTSPHTVVDGHTLAVEWRTRLIGNWLYLQISPQALFHRKADFRLIPVLFTDLEIIF